MPCNSDYMDASNKEIELSKVACLLDELNGQPINDASWEGYHPKIYNKDFIDGDKLVKTLCEKLQKVNVKDYSLEMQMWWRDHQKADKKRLESEITLNKNDRQKALSKLTAYERKLLNLE